MAGLLQQYYHCLLHPAAQHGVVPHATQRQRLQLAQLGAACHSSGIRQGAAEFKPLEPPMWCPWRLQAAEQLGQGLLC